MTGAALTRRIEVRVVPGAKKNEVREANGAWKVYLTAPAVEGKANQALIKVLAEHFEVKKRGVSIVRGELSRHKVIDIIREK